MMLPLPILLPLIGAGIGGLTNKKNPLKGALIGGALGATGGALGGNAALSSALGGQAASPMASYLATGAAEGSTLGGAALGGGGTGAVGSGSAAGMLQSLGGFAKDAAGYAGPLSQAMQTAQMARGLMSPQPMQQAPIVQHQAGQDPIAAILAQQSQAEEMRRKMRGQYGVA